MGINFTIKVNKNVKYKYNGVEYKSLDEMPEEARKIFESAEFKNKVGEAVNEKLGGFIESLPSEDSGKKLDSANAMFNNVITSSGSGIKLGYVIAGIIIVLVLYLLFR